MSPEFVVVRGCDWISVRAARSHEFKGIDGWETAAPQFGAKVCQRRYRFQGRRPQFRRRVTAIALQPGTHVAVCQLTYG